MKAILTGIVLLLWSTVFSQAKDFLILHFQFDSYRLTSEAKQQIDSFWLRNRKDNYLMEFALSGHCDSSGTDRYNDRLSEKRARAVQEYIIQKGASPENFLGVNGGGEKSPLNENKTAAERQLNRRVEISIYKSNYPVAEKKEEVTSLRKKISDSSTRVGTNLVLRNINFEGGRHQFLPESMPALEELLAVMNGNPSLEIRVEGHICCQPAEGDGTDNETGLDNLSEARARAVRDYLLSNGIASNRVSYKGFGHSAPLYPYPEQTPEEMKENRRVEIKVLKK